MRALSLTLLDKIFATYGAFFGVVAALLLGQSSQPLPTYLRREASGSIPRAR